jgi:RHS repeat-associated protein
VIAETTTTYAYDQIGRTKSETVSATGSTDQLATTYTYDTGSRPKSTKDMNGLVTSISYDSMTQTTTTLPGGGTKITQLYVDGSAKAVTGTAIPDHATSYSYDSSGNFVTAQTTAGQTSTTVTDWLRRPLTVTSATWGDGTTPGTRVLTSAYDSGTGHLLSQTTTSGGAAVAPKHLFEYDLYGRLTREGATVGSGTSLAVGTDFSVKDYESGFQTGAPGDPSNWYHYDRVKVYPYDGANSSIGRYFSQTYRQASGLGSTVASHVVTTDFDHNAADTTTTVDRTMARVATTTTATGTTQPLAQVSINGLVIKSTNAQGQTTLQTYDALGRLGTTTDSRGLVTDFVYYANTGQVQTATAPDTQTTGYAYDGAGHIRAQTDPNRAAYFQYDAAGNLAYQWGDSVNPVRYEYNDLGQKTAMHTYRSGTWTGSTLPSDFSGAGDITTWNYQSTTGLLTSKVDSSGKGPSYEYTAAGQMSKRTDARSVVTSYVYTALNLLQTVSYSDGTPNLSYTYDRNGQKKTVTDAAGQRSFGYYDTSTDTADNTTALLNKSARLQTETLAAFLGSHTLTYDYQYGTGANGVSRGAKLDTGSLYNITYGYDAVLRLNSVIYNGATAFTYAYQSDSNLLSTVGQGTGYAREYDYQTNSNRLDKLKQNWGGAAASGFEARLTYDTLGRRNTEKTQATSYMAMLNRSSEAGVDVDFSYTDPVPENHVDRSELRSSGKYVMDSTWSVGGLRLDTARDFNYDPIGNRTADQNGLYSPNGLNQYAAAPGIAALGYDLNGNLTSDGTRTYTYDAENRLKGVTQGASSWAYVYDYLGRRIQKSGTGIATLKFLYDGWNMIAELDGSGTIVRRFVWGLDVSLSLQGAGGVGGLLQIDDGSGTQRYPIYDASHNVIGLYDGAGATVAAYEYDPFGNLQTIAGSYGSANPFRSATKYTDSETGFVYYGLRYYVPQLGRFINRDPVEEQGGVNLYAFCSNDAVNGYDLLGMQDEVAQGGYGASDELSAIENKLGAKPPEDNSIGLKPIVVREDRFTDDQLKEFDRQDAAKEAAARDLARNTEDTIRDIRNTQQQPMQNTGPNSTATTTTGATWGDALSSFGKWVAGTLPTNQGFGPDTGQTQDMMKAPGVQRAIDYFYTKNANNGPDNQQSVENYQAGFGLKGLVQSGLNPTQQFVGNYRVDIYPNANGTLSVQLSNTTSMTSFLYGLGPNWNQSTFAPGGNASQLYYWTQPNKNVPQTGKPGGAGGTW